MTHCSLHYLDENRGGAKYWPGISGVRDGAHSKFPFFNYAAAQSTSSLQRSPSSSAIMGASDAIVFYILDPLFLLKGTMTSVLVNSDPTIRVSRAQIMTCRLF